ncbi:nickel-dependent hydrogenase large subunit [Halomonas faecis]|uniref:nickel-dependent hydrogenase large subunit n=1 Tax=Halomonas faecis TaxID=1562110 RepID=UPI0013CFF5AB|nr:nickel-dependent hydrogenase large subunit [Halomonas faecis]
MSRRIVAGPFNRVEGDLEITLDVADGRVRRAYVNSPLFRGIERAMLDRPALDALFYAPRICGICSVSQSVAAADALAEVAGVEPPCNAELARNLLLANENLADHLTHFYLFFMPDFAREEYAAEPWFGEIRQRFQAVKGTATADAVPARARFLHLMGYLGGKWPHTMSLQPGGTTRAIERGEKARLLGVIREFRRWLERHFFGDTLESFAGLSSQSQLERWLVQAAPSRSDLGRFLRLAEALDLASLGRGPDRYLSYGTYREAGQLLFPRGVWSEGMVHPLRLDQVTEDSAHAWMSGGSRSLPPHQGVTEPDVHGTTDAYTWCKAPRLEGMTMETGALSRQLVSGHPLAVDMVCDSGGNVRNRVVARALELAQVLPLMERWVKALDPEGPFRVTLPETLEGQGIGLVEAARGSLGHWVTIEAGKIRRYQIIAPTTWNFSPRDRDAIPGPLEQALVGVTASGSDGGVAVQHVVRSFDPCMSCTVH